MNTILLILARLVVGACVLAITLGALFLIGYGLVALVSLWPFADLIGEIILSVVIILLLLAGAYATGKEFID